jgi:hypothetical protein
MSHLYASGQDDTVFGWSFIIIGCNELTRFLLISLHFFCLGLYKNQIVLQEYTGFLHKQRSIDERSQYESIFVWDQNTVTDIAWVGAADIFDNIEIFTSVFYREIFMIPRVKADSELNHTEVQAELKLNDTKDISTTKDELY